MNWNEFSRPCLVVLGLALIACTRESATSRETVLAGEAMGTTWRVTFPRELSGKEFGETMKAIAERIEDLEAKLSHWRPSAEIAQFNRRARREATRMEVSPETAQVTAFAQEMREQTGGAFDVTVAVAVAAAGFGPGALAPRDVDEPVSRAEQLAVTADPPALEAKAPGVAIDLSGLAKGYAVDRVAALLDARGESAYLIEFGGELKGRGSGPRGRAWTVGIEAPDPARRAIALRVELADEAIATSGNYRLFRAGEDGAIVSHLIDPRSERNTPRDMDFRSVSVIHSSAMEADAWATALFVMGDGKGLAAAEDSGLAACFLRKEESSGEIAKAMTAKYAERAVK